MCQNDFYIINPIQKKRRWKETKFLKIACRRCLFCRIDKTTWIQDAGNWEWNHYGTASFATLTYDPINLVKMKRQRYLEDGEIRYTCRYQDGVEWIDRVRKHIINHGLNSKTLNRNFKYLMATEYGEQDQLPHIHAILFGIDFKIGAKLLDEKWGHGFIDVKPLLNGGIRYVSEYIMQEKFGKDAEETFDRWGLEQPKVKHSKGYGGGLIKEQLEFIKEHNGQYMSSKGILRPIPQYYKEKYNLPTHTEAKKLIKQYEMHNIKPTQENLAKWGDIWRKMRYAEEINKMRNNGHGITEEQQARNWQIDEMATRALNLDDGDIIPF